MPHRGWTRTSKLRRGRQVDQNQEQEQRRRSLAVGAMVKAALRQDRLLFAFQPVVCAVTGEVDYFECLLRMRHEDGDIRYRGRVHYDDRTPRADRPRRPFRPRKDGAGARHPSRGQAGFNVSGLTACDRPWLRSLMSVLRNRPDLARRLVVEITETAALYDIEENCEVCRYAASCGLSRRSRRFWRRSHIAAAPPDFVGRHREDRWLVRPRSRRQP